MMTTDRAVDVFVISFSCRRGFCQVSHWQWVVSKGITDNGAVSKGIADNAVVSKVLLTSFFVDKSAVDKVTYWQTC